MNSSGMLDRVIGALLPTIVTMMLGYFAARHHDFKQSEVPTLNRMVMKYALPLSLFVGVVNAGRADLLLDLPLVAILAIAMTGMYWTIFLFARVGLRYSAGLSALGALAASAPSCGFVGVAVLGYLYSEKADIPVAVGSIIIVLALVPPTLIILSLDSSKRLPQQHGSLGNRLAGKGRQRKGEMRAKILEAINQPVLWLPLLGFILVLSNIRVPGALAISLTLLGHAAAGVALFSSGIIIAGSKVVLNARVASLVFIKNVLQPSLVLGTMLVLGYRSPILGEAVLTTALPTLVLVVMLSVEYRIAETEATSTLFFSTVGSLLSISAFIALVSG